MGIQPQDVLIETRQARLAAFDEQRIRAALPISWNRQFDLPSITLANMESILLKSPSGKSW